MTGKDMDMIFLSVHHENGKWDDDGIFCFGHII